MGRSTLLLILSLLLALCAFIGTSEGGWTLIHYIAGDNNLDAAARASAQQIIDDWGSTDGIDNFYLFIDRASSTPPLVDIRTTEGVYLWNDGNDLYRQLLGEVDSGDLGYLVSLVNFATSQSSSERFLLCLWDHGAADAGFGEDEHGSSSGGGFSSYPQIAEALEQTDFYRAGHRFDVLQFAACNQANLEGYAFLSKFAHVILGFETLGWVYGNDVSFPFRYGKVFDKYSNPDEWQLSEDICDQYVNYVKNEKSVCTVFGTAGINKLLSATERFARYLSDSIRSEGPDGMVGPGRRNLQFYFLEKEGYHNKMVDIQGFCNVIYGWNFDSCLQITEALEYVSWNSNGYDHLDPQRNLGGVGIWFPLDRSIWSNQFTQYQRRFGSYLPDWIEMLNLYYTTVSNPGWSNFGLAYSSDYASIGSSFSQRRKRSVDINVYNINIGYAGNTSRAISEAWVFTVMDSNLGDLTIGASKGRVLGDTLETLWTGDLVFIGTVGDYTSTPLLVYHWDEFISDTEVLFTIPFYYYDPNLQISTLINLSGKMVFYPDVQEIKVEDVTFVDVSFSEFVATFIPNQGSYFYPLLALWDSEKRDHAEFYYYENHYLVYSEGTSLQLYVEDFTQSGIAQVHLHVSSYTRLHSVITTELILDSQGNVIQGSPGNTVSQESAPPPLSNYTTPTNTSYFDPSPFPNSNLSLPTVSASATFGLSPSPSLSLRDFSGTTFVVKPGRGIGTSGRGTSTTSTTSRSTSGGRGTTGSKNQRTKEPKNKKEKKDQDETGSAFSPAISGLQFLIPLTTTLLLTLVSLHF